MQAELLPRVQKVFAQSFGRQLEFAPELSRSAAPRWTSLKHVEFLIGLESEFGIRFDGADATDMTSIPTIVEIIRRRLS
jgi:acyl carrier protein